MEQTQAKATAQNATNNIRGNVKEESDLINNTNNKTMNESKAAIATTIATDNGTTTTATSNASAAATAVSLPGAEPNIIEQPLTLRVLNNDIYHHQHRPHQHHQHLNEVIEVEIQDNNNRGVRSSLVNPLIKNDEYSCQANENSHLNDNNNNNNNNHNNTNNTDTNNLVNTTITLTKQAEAEAEAKAEAEAEATVSIDSKKIDCTRANGHIVNETSSIPLTNSSRANNTNEENILDIPSHLIETFNDYHNSDENIVRIKELTPIEAELQSGLSKVETTDCIGRTIIEVEPAGLISKKPIAHIVECPKRITLTEIVDEVDNSQYCTQLKLDKISDLIGTNHCPGKIPDNDLNNLNNKKDEEAFSATIFNLENGNDSCKESTTTEKQSHEDSLDAQLSKQIDQQLSEVSCILESQHRPNGIISNTLKLITVPSPKTIADEKERQLFIDSLPQINEIINDSTTRSHTISLDFNKEYYQSLKKYLIQNTSDRPPIPLKTYRWEDLRRAKERGGYPWTHLYKHPLGPDEEPEIILMLRKSQEIHFSADSPKSTKKVRIDEQVTVKEAKRYLQELSEEGKHIGGEETEEHLSEPHLTSSAEDTENHSLQSESFSCVSDSILTTGKRSKKPQRFSEVRRLFRRRRYGTRQNEDIQSLPDTYPVKEYAAKKQNLEEKILQANHSHNTPHIAKRSLYDTVKVGRCFPIMKKLKTMADRQKKRLKIKRISLGKDERITFNEETKILKLKNSPKSQRSDIAHFVEKQDSDDVLEIVELEESPSRKRRDDEGDNNELIDSVSVVKPEEIIDIPNDTTPNAINGPPKKTPRLRREHVYEEINEPVDFPPIQQPQFNFILDATSVEALKQSLVTQDRSAMRELAPKSKIIPLDRMGSSEEEQLNATDQQHVQQQFHEGRSSDHHLAPISSIDSTSSDEDRTKVHLPQVIEEESDQPEDDQHEQQTAKHVTLICNNEIISPLPSAIKKEASPVPSEKKVTFSHVEDEAEPHREDIELSVEHMAALKEANQAKINATRDHEYEPIGSPSDKLSTLTAKEKEQPKENSPLTEGHTMKHAETVQRDLEMRFFNTTNVLPQIDVDVTNVSTVYKETVVQETTNKQDKKGFMASAQGHTRKMHAGLKSQAGKLKMKLRSSGKKSPSGSPKFKDRKRFKALEFSKIKMPDIKRPDMSKLKELKRPEFTKFNKVDMSRFKFPEKITTMKLKRSKSLKENEEEATPQDETSEISPKSETLTSQKKMFDFNFGTYPRALSRNKKKKAIEPESSFETTTEATSAITSTGTHPSFESSSSPQGDRGPGPVRSRWADKFSDVSYNDSEGSRYRRFESEQGSFDRESSIERRMREDVEDAASEEPTLTILGGVTDNKQFAEFDEENRAIHEISNLRSSEFKRRPIVHQDSDVKSDDSKDVIGWTEKDIMKNTILVRGEVEADETFMRRQPEDSITQETQSTTSSGKKLVLEEIDEDEFFLRKRGISQDNIELRQYISDAIRGKYDTSNEQIEDTRSYRDYEHTPPPKPRRLYRAENDFQHNYFDDDNENFPPSEQKVNRTDFQVPKVPLRKLRGRHKYADDEQSYQLSYFDNDEDYLRPPSTSQKLPQEALNNLNGSTNQGDDYLDENTETADVKPQPPRRQKRRREISLEKDSFINGFGGRSVSNSFLQTSEDVIVYRTEHEYHHIPLATPDKYSDSLSVRKSLSNYDDYEDHKSPGAASLDPNLNAEISDKYLMELNENDGYAVVRKDHVPKPTPPARRKKFARLPGERFATMPSMTRSNRSTSPPERPPPPKTYTPSTNHLSSTVPNVMENLNARLNQNKNVAVDELEVSSLRPESPRDLHSGDVINKMKYRPLPPPPRPPREKRQNIPESSDMEHTTDTTEQQFDTSSQEPKEDDSVSRFMEEVEASTQTDPLPDDFVCEEFEITDDMKVIVPRIYTAKTLDQILQEECKEKPSVNDQVTGSEQLTRGLQNFREANQRSLSERSRTSSQAEQRSKSLSRPQTPSAIVVEHEMLTPVPKGETIIEASLVVQPLNDHDLALDEEAIHQNMELLSPSSQSNLSLTKDESLAAPSEASYAPSSNEINEAIELLASDPDAQQTDEEVERTLQRYREELDEIGRQLMETTMSQDLLSVHSKDDTKEISDREEIRSDEEPLPKAMQDYTSGSEVEPFRSDDETQYESKVSTTTLTLTEQEQTQRINLVSEKELPPAPQPPPRKKSVALDQLTPEEGALEPLQQIPIVQSLVRIEKDPTIDLPCRVGDLEVDRLHVHALQAGQIMVSQLHGSDELDCKSGNLIVKNIEIPPGLIEGIVERVRQTEKGQLQTSETQTQTSLEGSPEKHFTKSPPRDTGIPPPKPPRLKDIEVKEPLSEIRAQNADEETQTDLTLPSASSIPTAIPALFPSTEYLQSLAPLAFYNLHRATNGSGILEMSTPYEISRIQQRKQHQPHKRSISANDIDDGEEHTVEDDDKTEGATRTRQTRNINRTKSIDDTQSVSQAGRKFITACSLSLVKIINQLTDYVRGSKVNNANQEINTSPTDIRNRQVPALVVLFIVITFAVLIFLATGRNIHTHHWDYFNPPGHDGRQSS